MRSSIKYGFAGIAAAGLLVAGASGALADTAPTGGTPAGPSIGLTITNPATATVAVSETSVAINALNNDTEATTSPLLATTFAGVQGNGALYDSANPVNVDVVSNNADGYSLDATSSDLTGPGGNQPAFDINIVAADGTDGSEVPTPITGHLGAAAGTLLDPAYVNVLSNTGTSAAHAQLNDWAIGHGSTAPTTPAGTDETSLGFFIQPNTLLGSAAGYAATVGLYYVPNP